MIETKSVTIGANTFSITSFNARSGLKIKMKLIRLLAPLSKLLGNKSIKEVLDKEIDSNSIQKAIEAIVSNLTDDLVQFIMHMLSTTNVDNKPINDDMFDVTFANNYESLYLLIWEVIKHNNFLSKKTIGKIIGSAPMMKV